MCSVPHYFCNPLSTWSPFHRKELNTEVYWRARRRARDKRKNTTASFFRGYSCQTVPYWPVPHHSNVLNDGQWYYKFWPDSYVCAMLLLQRKNWEVNMKNMLTQRSHCLLSAILLLCSCPKAKISCIWLGLYLSAFMLRYSVFWIAKLWIQKQTHKSNRNIWLSN